MGLGGSPANVSVALCTHNGATFLEQQLRSILSQDPAPAEVVLSDDASSDDTVAIAERVAAEYGADAGGRTTVKVLRNAVPLGVTSNFEQAIRACTGDVIALSDQDDVWHPGRLARLVAVLAERPEALAAASDATLIDADGDRLPHSLFEALEVTAEDLRCLNGDDAFLRLMRRNVVTGATMVLRRDLLDVALPFPASWVHDEWLATVAAGIGGVAVLEDRLIDYRQHDANQIGVRRASFAVKLRRLVEPRGQRNERLLARAESLVDRVASREDAFSPSALAVAEAKLHHEQARSALPVWRVRRLIPIVRESVRGGYGAYGWGMQDALRDLLQPARERAPGARRRFSAS